MANKLWSSVQKGAYAGGTAYTVGDFVTYNGSSYTCILNTTGNLPTNTTYWALIASIGSTGATGATGSTGATGPTGPIGITWKGAYNGATAYVVNDGVSYSGSSYICILASTGNLPTNTTYWNVVAAKGTDGTGTIATIASANGSITVTGTVNTDLAVAKSPILSTARAIYGNNFDGSAALAQVIASTYGGTGNGFTKFSGPTTSEKTFTLPDANATIARTDAAQTFTGIQTIPQVVNTPLAATVTSNAATITRASRINNFTNSSAATMAITLSTTGALDGDMLIVRIYDFSAAAQTIGYTNTENSTLTAPTTSNGSTTLPLTTMWQFNGGTSKWRFAGSF